MKRLRIDPDKVREFGIQGVKWQGDGALIVFVEGDGEGVLEVEAKVTKKDGAWFRFIVDGTQLGGKDDD